jgi:hypothetical protein
MNLFGTVSGKQIDEFAAGLARELAQRVPAQASGKASRPSTPQKLFAALDAIYAKASGFADEHKLGVYKKARLANAFRWELIALGYDKPFAEEMTQHLVVQTTRKA